MAEGVEVGESDELRSPNELRSLDELRSPDEVGESDELRSPDEVIGPDLSGVPDKAGGPSLSGAPNVPAEIGNSQQTAGAAGVGVLRSILSSTQRRSRDFQESRTGSQLIRSVKYLIQFSIVAVLLWQIYTIGLANILRELPRVPLFYIIFLAIYFALPLTEFFTYRQSFPVRFWSSQLIFLKKRIYNTTVIGYLGEVQLFAWLQKEVGAGKKRAFEVVRDNNTLSTAASTSIVLLLLSGFVGSGELAVFDALQVQIRPPVVLGIAGGVFGLMVFLVRRFRRYLFSMTRREGWTIFLLHTGRMLMLTVLQTLQWYVVMPEVALSSWFTLLSVQLILSRIPFLPNKDLLFLAAGVGLGGLIHVEPAAIAGILLAHQVLDKALSILIFAGISVGEARSQTQ